MVCLSAAAGITTLALVARSRFGPARAFAALAVAAIIAGWAIAQEPRFLPGLTIEQVAAGRSTLLAIVIATAAGAAVLFPSLALLFGLFLHGRLDAGPARAAGRRRQAAAAAASPQARPGARASDTRGRGRSSARPRRGTRRCGSSGVDGCR